MGPMPRLFLIDSFGFIFRAYHARARSGAPPMRTSSGLSTEAVYILHNMLRKLAKERRPDYMAAIFESAEPTFRSEHFADYKANRTEMPADLGEQIPWIRTLLGALRIPILEYPGFEADDVLGTMARQAAEAGTEVVIVSSDKDMLQVVTDRVSMFNPVKEDIWYDPKTVEEFMGVPPSKVADLLALKGDAIDNIPGAPGIGDKGAKDIIMRFGSVENALEHAGEVERKMYRESLQNHRDQILLSKRLATVDCSVPVEWNLADLAMQPPDTEALKRVYRDLEFYSLLRELGPSEDARAVDYQAASEPAGIEAWIAAAPPEAAFAVAVPPPAKGELIPASIGLAYRQGEARSVPLDQVERLKPLLEDPARPKIVHDAKSLIAALAQFGIETRGVRDDIMLYAFLLCADPSGCSPEAVAERNLDRRLGSSPEQHADFTLELAAKLRPQIEERGLAKLYEEIELPLTAVLARMETTGIRIEPDALRTLSGEMEAEVQRLTAEIHALAGKPFNINSPQQLGKVLFEELHLPVPVKYGRGKAVSTAADVLEDLAPVHDIARLVLEYRQLVKLKGTYVDALPALIDPVTARLHTSFNQTGAATGRLSSSNPNLQNIPIRTALGREIRAAFVPEPGWKMVVADYSQIELRLLAHMSHDPVLVEAFRNGEDIHTRTAAEVLGVPPLMITPDQRRSAKAVNFGIVYGQTAFGLAAQLGIDRKEAELYIRAYFERYAGVRKFIDATIAEVRETGIARTMFGRQRPIPDMNSRNANARGFAERTAVNTPLQGSAADMIKLAMIHIDEKLRTMQSRMLLQVHDELVFEAPPDEVERLSKLVKSSMEAVCRLEVPLIADIGVGDNWRDAK